MIAPVKTDASLRRDRSGGVVAGVCAGIAKYNRPDPPFKAKTKAGNVNAWLDAHGWDYDFFVQFDIDHLPEPIDACGYSLHA